MTLKQITEGVGKLIGLELEKICFLPGRGNCKRNCALYIEGRGCAIRVIAEQMMKE